jgi:hypothetical protein
MGLINLLTNPKNFKFYNGGQGYTGNGTQPSLTNIPYGKDRIDGGSSNQPYIQIPIPDNVSSLGLANNDFLLRGGALSVENAATDALRLTKMFFDTKSPNGLLFIAKQQLLSRTAVRTQTSGILNAGGYNPLGTLAQAGIINIGGHLNKQGDILAETGAYSTNDNLYGVKITPEQLPINNRLVQLYNLSSTQKPSVSLNGITLNNGINVMTYTGGPGSTLGAGSTNIRYSPTSKTFLTKAPTNTYTNTYTINSNIWLYDSKTLDEQKSVATSKTILSPSTQDFRAIIRKTLENNFIGPIPPSGIPGIETGQLAYAPSYDIGNGLTIEQRVNLGDPGYRSGKNYAKYDLGVTYPSVTVIGQGSYNPGLDKITSLPIYRSQNVVDDHVKNDLCKFRIAIIDNDNPGFKTFMHFRAFLGSISDSYNANWNPVQYLGRGEQFFTYGGFTRQISLSWTVAAQSKQELIPMYKKLNYLASSLAPDYSPKGYMRGNLAQLTIGGYIYELPGIITGLTYDIGEDTPWEIGIKSDVNGGEDGTVKELPHIIRVTGFNFTPIHKFIPKKQELKFDDSNSETSADKNIGFVKEGKDGYGLQHFISIANGPPDTNSNYNINDTGPKPKD